MVREAPKQPAPKDEWADDDDDINTGLWSSLPNPLNHPYYVIKHLNTSKQQEHIKYQ